MKSIFSNIAVSLVLLSLGFGTALATEPEADRKAFVNFYMERFPDTPYEDYINGIYSIDEPSREQWEAIEEFPPYEIAIGEGEDAWNTAFANGKSYQSCFDKTPEQGLRADYPKWDAKRQMVVTMESAINDCRVQNGEKALKTKKGQIVALSAYVTMGSRGQTINVTIPDAGAMKAYEAGKQFFYAKRGQLNVSCADCHIYNVGNWVRADRLGPALGNVSHFPVYRSKWGAIGTLHRRFTGCNKNIRAKPFKAQGPEYKNLEYFLAYMSNGLVYNGPASRK